MKNIPKLYLIATIASVFALPVFARDDVADYSIAEALELKQAKTALGDQIRFFFGDQTAGNVVKNFGEFRTNKKTNAFGKSDKKACQWVFLSAMISLRDRAVTEGANTVINIKSNYKNNLTVNDTIFRCGAGGIMAGVALIGTVVTIE